jgi:hypothetical protein
MKVSARSTRNGIVLKRLAKTERDRSVHTAGTVVMRKVHLGSIMLGEVLEESDRKIYPVLDDGMFSRAVKNWSQARYVRSLGGYFDMKTGQKIASAEYVYMVGSKIYYTD